MRASYSEIWKKESTVARVAADLRAKTTWPCRLSPLVLMTDPERLPDVAATVRALPREAAVIYRHFGKDDRLAEATELRALTTERGQQLLIGTDPELAEAVGADGVHYSRDANLAGPREWRVKRPDWIITMAGLKSGHYEAAFDSLDALFLSSVFPSESPSAGAPIGVDAFSDRVARLLLPVYALGGVDAQTVTALQQSGAAGIAGIGGLGMEVQKEATEAGHRFVIYTDHGEAELTLARVKDGVFNANHTFTPNELRGQGVAGKLYTAMVADAKAEGYKIVPGCPYVEVKFKRRPEDRAAVGVK